MFSENRLQVFEEFDGLIYRTASLEDTEALWQLMASEFYPRTPLCSCLRMQLPDDVEILHSLLPAILKHGVTLIAEDKASGKLVGARPTTIDQLSTHSGGSSGSSSSSSSSSGSSSSSRHPLLSDPDLAARYSKCSAVYRMFDHLSATVDLAEKYNVDRAMSFKFLVVARTHARQGIAKKLVQLSMDLAAKLGVPLATTCTASVHSEHIYSALGFDRLNELRLVDYVDGLNGLRPFSTMDEAVLRSAVLYAKKI